jgi:hypothetical protein
LVAADLRSDLAVAGLRLLAAEEPTERAAVVLGHEAGDLGVHVATT